MHKKIKAALQHASKKIKAAKAEQVAEQQKFHSWKMPFKKQKGALPKSTEPAMTIHIPATTVLKATLVVLGTLLLSQVFAQLLDILVMFFVALFFSAALNPAVDRLERWGISRALGIVVLFFLVFIFFAFLLGTLAPIMAQQLTEIGTNTVIWAQQWSESEDSSLLLQKLRELLANAGISEENWSQQLAENANQIFAQASESLQGFIKTGASLIVSTFSALFKMILVLLLTFFLVLDRSHLSSFFHSLFPHRYQEYLTVKMHAVQIKIGEWVHGQVLLFFIVGGIAFVGLKLIGVEYALTLALVAGIAEFIPYLGPLIAFATAAPVAFAQGMGTGVAVIIFYSVLQVLEGNVIVPLVMRRAVGLPPIVTIIALVVGASFPDIINPILGMILAVPLATIIAIFVQDLTKDNS